MKKYSKDGYKRNSKDKNNPYNVIPSGNITMKDVDFPVHGTDNLGNSQIMMPGGEYVFPGNEVLEVPLAQEGGSSINAKVINTQAELDSINKVHDDWVIQNKKKLLNDGDSINWKSDPMDLDRLKKKWEMLQDGGEQLKKFQPGGQVLSDGKFYTNAEIAELVNSGAAVYNPYALSEGKPMYTLTNTHFYGDQGPIVAGDAEQINSFQSEVPDPGMYPEPDPADIFIDEESIQKFKTAEKLIEDKLYLATHELEKAQQRDLLDKKLKNIDNLNKIELIKSGDYNFESSDFLPGLNPSYEQNYEQVDNMRVVLPHVDKFEKSIEGLSYTLPKPDTRSEAEKQYDQTIRELEQEYAELLETYIKPEFLLPPEDPNSYYHDHYQKLVNYKIAETAAYYEHMGQPRPYFNEAGDVIENPNPYQATFQKPSKSQFQMDQEEKQRQYIFEHYEPNPMIVGYEVYNEWKKDPTYGWNNLGIDWRTQTRPKSTVHPSMHGFYSSSLGYSGALQSGNTAFMNDFHRRRMNEMQGILLMRVPIPGLNTMKIRNPLNLAYGYGANAHKYMTIPGVFDYGLKGLGWIGAKTMPKTTKGVKNLFNTGSWDGIYRPPQGNISLKSQIKDNPFNLIYPKNIAGQQAFTLNPRLSRPSNISPDNWNFLNQQAFTFNPNISASNIRLQLPSTSNLRLPGPNVKPNTGTNLIGTDDLSMTSNLLNAPIAPVAQPIGNRYINYDSNLQAATGSDWEKIKLDVPKGEQQTIFDLNNVGKNVLQVNALREGSPAYKKLLKSADKNGFVQKSLLEKIIRESSGVDKLYLERAYNNPLYTDAKKIHVQTFKNDVSSQIVPLNKLINTSHNINQATGEWELKPDGDERYAHFMYENLGYTPEEMAHNINGVTVSLQNPQVLGTGDTHLGHGSNLYNLGWFRGNWNKNNPQVFTLMENQSNWYSKGNKSGLEESIEKSEIKDHTIFSKPPKDWKGTREEWIKKIREEKVLKHEADIAKAKEDLAYHKDQWDRYLAGNGYISVQRVYAPNHPHADMEKIHQGYIEGLEEKIGRSQLSIDDLTTTDIGAKLNLTKKDGIYNRILAESILYAAQNGATTFRIPTVQTSAKFQNHQLGAPDTWEKFQTNISGQDEYVRRQIISGANLDELSNPFEHQILNTGGIKMVHNFKPEYLDRNGNVKNRFERRYKDELDKLNKKIKFESDQYDIKRKAEGDRLELNHQQDKSTLIDMHYELYLLDESLYTGSHQRFIRKEAMPREFDPVTGEAGPIPYREVATRNTHDQPFREALYLKQKELGRLLTKEELIEEGWMLENMISTSGGRYDVLGGGRQNPDAVADPENNSFQPWTKDELKRAKKLASEINFWHKGPQIKLQEWESKAIEKLHADRDAMELAFINNWYGEPDLYIPNTPGNPDAYTMYSPTNNNLQGGDQLVDYYNSYSTGSTFDPNNPNAYYDVDGENWSAIYKRVQKQPEIVKKWFGDDVELVLVKDAYGNEFYQFVIPQSVYDGTWELPHQKYGGQIYQNGGESYIKGSSEDPNIYPDQEWTWYNPLDWYRSYTSISPEEVLANARKEGYESWYSVLPKHLQNTNYYDLEGAYEAGLDPVWSEDHNEYHLGSRDPRTGRLFKYEDHPTFDKLVQGETDEGNVIWYDNSGNLYSGKEVPEGMFEFEEYSDQYLHEYLQHVENAHKTGFDPVTGLWIPYKGVDSNNKKEKFYTIGYGHKLSKEEYKLYKNGVSQEKVDEFLQEDIAEAQRKLDTRYGKHQWYRDLHPREKAILLDIEYNVRGGMNSFPKLEKAIREGNKTLLLTEFWRELPQGKNNKRNQEFKKRFIIPVSNMYKYNKRQLGGEIKQIEKERPVWDKRRSRLKQQLKVYQQGGEISPFAEEELISLGLINPQDDLSMPMDNTAVVTNEIDFKILDPDMNLTPKSDNDEEFYSSTAGSVRSNQNDDENEDDIEDEEDETNDEFADTEEDTDTDEDTEEDKDEDEDEDTDDEDDKDDDDKDDDDEDDEDDDDDEDDEHFTPEPIEVESYASGRGSEYEKVKTGDPVAPPRRQRSQPVQVQSPNIRLGQIQEFKTPLPGDFTSELLAREFAGANYGEQQKPLTFDYLQRTYGDFNPARQQQMQQQARYGGSLPRAQEGGNPWWENAYNTVTSKANQATDWAANQISENVIDPVNEAVDLKGYISGEQGMIPDFYGQDTYGMTEDWQEGLDKIADSDKFTKVGKLASGLSAHLGNIQGAYKLTQIPIGSQSATETFGDITDALTHSSKGQQKFLKKQYTPPPMKIAQMVGEKTGLDQTVADAWDSGTEYAGDQLASVKDHYFGEDEPVTDQPLIAENQDNKSSIWSRMSDGTTAAADTTAPTIEEKEIPTAQGGGGLPNVFMNEHANQSYDQDSNTIYVHPEDVEGPEVPFTYEHEPDHVLRHELEHYYQNKDIVETTPMAPTALEYDIISNTNWHPGIKSDDPMSNRLIEDRELVMRDMYLQVLDPDGTNFWLQNMDIEDLMDEMAIDNEAINQLERQVMNQPVHVRDYMLARIRGERADRLYEQATAEVYYDPRTLEGQARMIEDDGRQDAHVIETLKHKARENYEKGEYENPYFKKEMKTLQKDK